LTINLTHKTAYRKAGEKIDVIQQASDLRSSLESIHILERFASRAFNYSYAISFISREINVKSCINNVK